MGCGAWDNLYLCVGQDQLNALNELNGLVNYSSTRSQAGTT